MSVYDLYDTMTQSDLNDLIDVLLENFHKEVDINLSELDDVEEATISVSFGGTAFPTESEILLTTVLGVNFSNPTYLGIKYSLRLNYYYLGDGDMDDTESCELQTKVFELENGLNFIDFNDYPVYLQNNAKLIITNEEIE